MAVSSLIVCLAVTGLPLFGSPLRDQKSPASHSETDEIAVQIAGYKRLLRDYCTWNKDLKTIFLVYKRGSPQHSPSDKVMNAVRRSFQGRVLPTEQLTEDMREGRDGFRDYADPKTQLPAAELAIHEIEWKGKGRAVVRGLFSRSYGFQLSAEYTLTKKNLVWRVIHVGVDYDRERRVMTGANNGHAFRLELGQRPFNLRMHRVVHAKGEYANEYLVDGKPAWGRVGGVPHRELTSFRMTVDGVPWAVSARLWRDCFEPSLGPRARYPVLFAWISEDGSKVTVKMLCSDGGGGYTAIWYLRKDGKHRRQVGSTA